MNPFGRQNSFIHLFSSPPPPLCLYSQRFFCSPSLFSEGWLPLKERELIFFIPSSPPFLLFNTPSATAHPLAAQINTVSACTMGQNTSRQYNSVTAGGRGGGRGVWLLWRRRPLVLLPDFSALRVSPLPPPLYSLPSPRLFYSLQPSSPQIEAKIKVRMLKRRGRHLLCPFSLGRHVMRAWMHVCYSQ